MDSGHARILGVATLVMAFAFPLAVAPVLAATCTLSASETAAIGTPIAIQGSGFPASTSIDVSLAIEGGATDSFTVQSDSTGAFVISLTPETADIGRTTVSASVGSTCSAQVAYSVLGTNQTAAPAAAPEAASGGTAPRTDAARPGRETGGLLSTGWMIAILSIAIGIGGLIATREPKRG